MALLGDLNSPFDVPDHNIGCVVADRGDVRAWLVRDELLSLVRFLGGNRDALKRNFRPEERGHQALKVVTEKREASSVSPCSCYFLPRRFGATARSVRNIKVRRVISHVVRVSSPEPCWAFAREGSIRFRREKL